MPGRVTDPVVMYLPRLVMHRNRIFSGQQLLFVVEAKSSQNVTINVDGPMFP